MLHPKKLRGSVVGKLIRMPEELSDAIRDKAKADGVSANAFIVDALYKAVGGFEVTLVPVKFEPRWTRANKI